MDFFHAVTGEMEAVAAIKKEWGCFKNASFVFIMTFGFYTG